MSASSVAPPSCLRISITLALVARHAPVCFPIAGQGCWRWKARRAVGLRLIRPSASSSQLAHLDVEERVWPPTDRAWLAPPVERATFPTAIGTAVLWDGGRTARRISAGFAAGRVQSK